MTFKSVYLELLSSIFKRSRPVRCVILRAFVSCPLKLVIYSAASLLLWAEVSAQQNFGYGGLSDLDQDFNSVVPDGKIILPQDYKAHPDFRLEWWYLTANLTDDLGDPLGIQWTLFRNALQAPNTVPQEKKPLPENQMRTPRVAVSPWGSPQMWMGHAAVTTAKQHVAAEKFARGGTGQAGVLFETDLKAWIDDWSLTRDSSGKMTIKASGDGFSYSLIAEPYGPEILQGDGGYSLKSPEGQASYYFSHPYLSLSGTVTLGKSQKRVTGKAWLDREWSSQLLNPKQAGWDWFALRLSGLGELVVFQIRPKRPSGTPVEKTNKEDKSSKISIAAETDFTYARLVKQGKAVAVTDIKITPWNPLPGIAPRRWRLSSEINGFDITVNALNDNSIMPFIFRYFEGPVIIAGSHTGNGYLEMTGYKN